MVERGYLKGYENGSFRPEITLSRGEFASFLVKYVKSENLEFPSNPKSFSDVDSSKWYYADIYQAAAWGLVNGYDDGTFRPDKGVNRGEAVTMLNRLLKRDFNSDGISLSYLLANNPFKDISTDYWGCIDVLEASVKHSFTKEETD